MEFHFLDTAGKHLYKRTDAIEAEHYCDDYACRMLFPCVDNRSVSAGMLIAWRDDDDLWECHEITSTACDAFGDTVEISGVHLAVADLRTMVLESAKYSEKPFDAVLDGLLSGTAWQRGVLASSASTDERARYRITTSGSRLNMRSGPGTAYSSIGKYKNGTYVVLIEITTPDWYRVEAPDGRIGWMSSDYLTGAGTAAGDMSGYTVTMDEKWTTVWAALESAAKSAEVLLTPRVEMYAGNVSGKYIDVRSTMPEFRGVRLTCDANVRDASVTYDVSGLYTALYGLGADDVTFADTVWTTAGGKPANKPKGQKYVEDPEAKAVWGRGGYNRAGIVRFDVKNKSELLQRTWDQLQKVNKPRIEIDAKVIDLYQMGYTGQSMRLYDMVYVIMRPIGLIMEARIINLTRDLLMPENTHPIIGTDLQRDFMRDVAAARSASSVALNGLRRNDEESKDVIGGGVVYVNMTPTGTANQYKADKTTTEIAAAYEGGSAVCCVLGGKIMPLLSCDVEPFGDSNYVSLSFSLYWGGLYQSVWMTGVDTTDATLMDNLGGVLHLDTVPVFFPTLSANKGKLFYVDANGELAPLTLGKGLAINDGVLSTS